MYRWRECIKWNNFDFETKFITVVIDPESQNVDMTTVSVDRASEFKSMELRKKLKFGLCWDRIHTNHLKSAEPVFRKLLCNVYNKMMSHCVVPCTMLRSDIRPIFKAGETSKTDSDNYRPVMISSVYMKLLKYLILPALKINLNLSSRHFVLSRYELPISCSDASRSGETLQWSLLKRSLRYVKPDKGFRLNEFWLTDCKIQKDLSADAVC